MLRLFSVFALLFIAVLIKTDDDDDDADYDEDSTHCCFSAAYLANS